MRYAVSVVVLFLLYTPLVDAAVLGASPEEASADAGEVAEPILLAQQTADDEDENIFKHLQIELLDLEYLGEQVRSRFVGEAFRLSLDDAVRMALLSNQDILIANFETLLADSDLLSALGEYDPTLLAEYNYRDSVTPPSPLQFIFGGITSAVEDERNNYKLALNGKVWWAGTQYSLELTDEREQGTFTGGNPIYAGDVTLTLTQPLLRGFGPNANMVQIRSAKNSQRISHSQVESAVLTSISDVIKAYWDLVGAIEQRTVRQESLANAMRLVTINEQRFEIGVAAAIEVLQAKAGAATRQSDLITAATAILDAEDVLKTLIGMYDEDLLSSNSIVPIERPEQSGEIGEMDWNLEDSMRKALQNRPEIRSAELRVENARLQAKSARNGLMPQLDASGSYGRNGRSLEFSDSVEDVRKGDGEIWSIGLTGSIPIGNRAARGSYTRAKLITRQEQQRLQKTRQDAMLMVRTALHGVAKNRILIESNKQARILQEANVAAEEKRLSLGVTTSQEVLDIQEDLTEAQTAEVQAQIDYAKSQVDLGFAEGTLLIDRGIVYEEMDEQPIGFWGSIGPRPSGE